MEKLLKSQSQPQPRDCKRDLRRYRCKICGIVRSRHDLLRNHILSMHQEEVPVDDWKDLIENDRSARAGFKDRRRFECPVCGIVRSKRYLIDNHVKSCNGKKKKRKSDSDTEESEPDTYSEASEGSDSWEEDEETSQGSSPGEEISTESLDPRDDKKECSGESLDLGQSMRPKENGALDEGAALENSQQNNLQEEVPPTQDVSNRSKSKSLSENGDLEVGSASESSQQNPVQEEVSGSQDVSQESGPGKLQHCCEQCGMSFRKTALLQQHKISHSNERAFPCPVDGCFKRYKLKYHLNIHMRKHKGETVFCPKEGCGVQLSSVDNLKRHMKRHEEKGDSWKGQRVEPKEDRKFLCPQKDCGKYFRYPSRLAKHLEDCHTESVSDFICCEPKCLESFPNLESLRSHIEQKHSRVKCKVCGSQQLKKQIKRHMRIHEGYVPLETIKCPFERCLHSYNKRSNLNIHIKAVHAGLRPFRCHFKGCDAVFAYKSARDSHEKTSKHVYIDGDFEEEDRKFRSRPRGGRKRKTITVEDMVKKRACPSGESVVADNGFDYLDWLISPNANK